MTTRFKKFTKQALVIVGAVMIFSGSAYGWDFYYSQECLEWFAYNNAEAWETGAANVPLSVGSQFYLFTWRVIENGCPALCDFLAPPPQLPKSISSKTFRKNDYYYDVWAGRTIRVKEKPQVAQQVCQK